jgi:hypothetical protein
MRAARCNFPAYYLVLGLAAATVGTLTCPAFVLYVMNWGSFSTRGSNLNY